MSHKVCARIPHQEVWNDFKDFVQKRHDKKHTVLGMELEEAIILYLKAQGFYGPATYDENIDRPISEPATIKGNTHTNQDSAYGAIYADLNGRKQIHRNEFEGILTRRLGLKTDKSRRDHLKTFEHLGILEPHPEVGHKILTVNQDNLDFSP